jgi:hypothetical protein
MAGVTTGGGPTGGLVTNELPLLVDNVDFLDGREPSAGDTVMDWTGGAFFGKGSMLG